MAQKMGQITTAIVSILTLVCHHCFAESKVRVSPGSLASQIEGSIYGQVARVYSSDPILIYALTLTASGRQVGDGYSPSPNLITVNGKSHNFKDRASATAFLIQQLELNHSNIAVGLAQINIRAFPSPDPSMLLDPFFNLVEASRVLQEMQKSTDDYYVGIGRFFTWSDDAKLWGMRVADNYQKVVFTSNYPIEITARK